MYRMGIESMLKSLRFLPLCVLFLSGYVFADGLSSYAKVIHDVVVNQISDSLDMYKGKSCSVRIGLSRDGTVLYAVDDGGDYGLCNTVVLALHSVKRFPPPPSEQIYQKIKYATFDFKF